MRHRRIVGAATVIQAVILVACADTSSDSESMEQPTGSHPTLEVTAIYDAASNQHLFVTTADTVPAGWTTIQLTNASSMIHFVFLDHLPGDRTSVDLFADVSPCSMSRWT
jgi:hypothetical protein